MKSRFPKTHLTGARWDILTVLFVSLTAMVCLLYAVIFLYPQVLPMSLQVPTQTPTQTSSAAQAVHATRPFPTFPAEWTAAYATRRSQAVTPTPTPLGRSSEDVTPMPSSTVTVTVLATTAAPTAAPTFSPSPASVETTTAEPAATDTSLPATATTGPATPLPTSSSESYPGTDASPTPPPDSTGYP